MRFAICILLLSASLAIILSGPGLRWLPGHTKLCVPARHRAGEPGTRGIYIHTNRSPWSVPAQEGGRPTRAQDALPTSNFFPKSNQVCGNMVSGRFQEGQLSTINPFAADGALVPKMFFINPNLKWHRELEAEGPGVFLARLECHAPGSEANPFPCPSMANLGPSMGQPGWLYVARPGAIPPHPCIPCLS